VNILTMLQMAAEANPERISVGSGDSSITYHRLHQLAVGAAVEFRRHPAERVVLCCESSAAVPVAMFGAAAAGMPYVPLNYRLPDADLRGLAIRSAPAVLLTDRAGASRIADMPDIDVLPIESLLEPDAAIDPQDRTDLERHSDRTPAEDPESIAVLLFTSGTTGDPKSAILRHRHLASYILGTVEFGGAEADEATLVSVPPYHIAGVSAMLSSVWAGRRIVLLPRFDADDWIDTVEREGITHAMVVPTMLTRIVEALDRRGGEPILGVRTMSYGGGRMPVGVIRRALELFPITAFVNAYGLTETSSTIALLGPDDHRLAQYSDDPVQRARLSSAGMPLPGVTVEIRDSRGTVLPAGEVGEIHVRGDQISGEYIEKGSLLDVHGWFPTKDNGYVDDAGYLFVIGRNDDVIIRGGENMSPGEIEDVLLTHPEIRDAAAFGVASTEWGECVTVAIVAESETPSPDEIRELVRSRLRSSRVPSHVVFVDDLPYNDTGKLLRRELRARFAHLGDDPV